MQRCRRYLENARARVDDAALAGSALLHGEVRAKRRAMASWTALSRALSPLLFMLDRSAKWPVVPGARSGWFLPCLSPPGSNQTAVGDGDLP